ncbi:flavin reductase family protein [Streptomyces sp. NPDC050315]|uniref:flavin reductase family protein n=1 Tax=Streptomyces sp. NPDC050315 TaxID=3155039 RepID=UPI0034471363
MTRVRHRGEALDTAAFRAAAGTFPSGVTVVATRYRGRTLAKTVSAFTSLSLDPLLVSAAIGKDSPLVWAARVSGVLTVNVLRHDQHRVSDFYAAPEHRRLGPAPAELITARSGGPVLDDCLSWFDCRLTTVAPGGDHAILIGRAIAAQVHGGRPLVHHEGGYHALAGALTPQETTAP